MNGILIWNQKSNKDKSKTSSTRHQLPSYHLPWLRDKNPFAFLTCLKWNAFLQKSRDYAYTDAQLH